MVHYLTTGSLQTKNLSLGSVSASNSTINIATDTPAGSGLTFTCRGSADAITWSANLVDQNPQSLTYDTAYVIDGSQVAPYLYYDITATFTSNGLVTPVLNEISITGGDSQFKYFSTHEDIPAGTNARPFLISSLGSLNSKLELMKLGSTGEVTPKLYYLRETFELLRDGYLRNKAVSIKQGFNNGMAAIDYEPLFTGVWHDASVNHYSGVIDVKTRTILARFAKVKLPKETATGSTRTDETCPPIEWINANLVTVMLDIVDLLGIPDRYIDRPSFTTLVSGARSGDNWLVSRRLDKDSMEDALKLLEEASVLAGVFILQQPDGKMVAQLYDPTIAATLEISADLATFGPIELGQADLFTRQHLLYGLRHEDDLETGTVQGAWAADKDYARNDSVTRSGVTYYCLLSHKSAASTEPAVGGSRFAFWTTEWTTATAYSLSEVVMRNGPLYTCKSAHTSAAGTEPGLGATFRDKWASKPLKKGSSEEDYYNALVYINQDAEVSWGLNKDLPPGDPDYQVNPGYQKTFMDKWSATDYARQALAERMDSWFANPRFKVKASDLPPQFYDVKLGAMVGITGLQIPIAGETWGVPCQNIKMMVMSKTFDPGKCTVSFDLLQV